MKKVFHESSHVCFIMFLAALLTVPGCTTRKSEYISLAGQVRTTAADTVNVNTADEEILQRLPRIGPTLARKIIEHRTRYGPFRKAEELILIEGFSDRRFREIQHLIAIE